METDMSQFTTLVLKDTLDADVAFANSRIDYSSGVATWLSAGATFDGKSKATFSLSLPNAKTTRARVKVKVAIPIMDTIDATKKVDEVVFNGEFVLPKNSTSASRVLLLAYVKSLMADDIVERGTRLFEGVY